MPTQGFYIFISLFVGAKLYKLSDIAKLFLEIVISYVLFVSIWCGSGLYAYAFALQVDACAYIFNILMLAM